MTTSVSVEHRTTYTFDRPIGIGPHLIRLRPAPHCRTPIEAYTLQIRPTEHFLHWQQDPYGNHIARVVFPGKSAELEITVGLVADLQMINPFDFFVEQYAERFRFSYPPSWPPTCGRTWRPPPARRARSSTGGWPSCPPPTSPTRAPSTSSVP